MLGATPTPQPPSGRSSRGGARFQDTPKRQERETVPLSFLPFPFYGVPRVRCAFQTRMWGVSEGPYACGNIAFGVGDDPRRVSHNRREFAATLGLSAIAELDQRGDAVVFDPPAAPPNDFDAAPAFPCGGGMATNRRGLGLVIKTADSQPVLVTDRAGEHIAAFRVGWKESKSGFLGAGIAAFCERYGLAPRDLLAVRGPSLGPAAAACGRFEEDWGPAFEHWFDASSRTLNLWRLTHDRLVEAGLPENALFGLDLCTASLPEAFFSRSRDGVCGRTGAVIWIGDAKRAGRKRRRSAGFSPGVGAARKDAFPG